MEAAAAWVHGDSLRAAPIFRAAVAESGSGGLGWHAWGPGGHPGLIGATTHSTRASGAGDVCVFTTGCDAPGLFTWTCCRERFR